MTAELPDDLSHPPVRIASDASWHRLHPLSPFVRAGRQLMSLVVLLIGISVLNQHQAGSDLVTDLVIIGVALVGGFVSWLVTRWQVADGVLRIEAGLLRRHSQRLPLSQIQAVDVVQSGLARVLGLAELQVRVAGGDSSLGGRLACLRRSDAEQLRRHLLELAGPGAGTASSRAGAAGPAGPGAGTGPAVFDPSMIEAGRPAAAGLERALFRVNPVRLAVGILLSRTGLIALLVVAATWVTVALTGHVGVLTPFLPFALGAVANLWRQFNGDYGTVVLAAPDGIRLRSGLIQTTAETIRPGRIQAVRIAEPLIWRAFGWCRLEVGVAGVRQRGENRAEGGRLRSLIPVGSRAEADLLLAELLASPLAPTLRPPRQARLKAPLTYHFLGWNGDDRYVVAARGRVCRQTTWALLEKVQSIRWVQGPLQRRLGLATVHLDVAGKRTSVRIEDRSSAEAAGILARLPDQARAARAR